MFKFIKLFLVKQELNSLSKSSGIVFPIVYLSLGRKISELPKENAHKLISDFYNKDHPLVKRALLIAIRFMGKETTLFFLDKILESSNDEWGWIKYDVAWALGDSEINDERVRDCLLKISGDFKNMSYEDLKNYEPKDEDEQAKKMASEKLIEYDKRQNN